MGLSQLELKGWGRFEEDRKAAFTIESADLPAPWEVIYQNRQILVRVDQHGPVYAQVDPPSGIMLFRREHFQRDGSSHERYPRVRKVPAQSPQHGRSHHHVADPRRQCDCDIEWFVHSGHGGIVTGHELEGILFVG